MSQETVKYSRKARRKKAEQSLTHNVILVKTGSTRGTGLGNDRQTLEHQKHQTRIKGKETAGSEIMIQ